MQTIKTYKTYYSIDNVRFDRVTWVLNYFISPELAKWQAEEGSKEIQKSSKSIGTRVHNLIQIYPKSHKFFFTPHDTQAIKNCCKGFERWYQIEKPNILLTEQTVFSEELGVAGTYDANEKDCLWDWKTANAIYPSYWLQLAIYNYMKGEKYKYIGILRLDKLTADYEAVKIEYDKRLTNCFLGLLNYYRFITNYNIKETDNGKDGSANTEISTRFSIFEPENSIDWAFRDRQE